MTIPRTEPPPPPSGPPSSTSLAVPPPLYPPEPEYVDVESVQDVDILVRDEFVTVWIDGRVEWQVRNPVEGKVALKSLQLIRQQFRLIIRELNTQLRALRQEYTHYTRTRLPKLPGGGDIGRLIRIGQTLHRDGKRAELANSLAPVQEQRDNMDRLVLNVDRAILQLQAWLHAK